MNTAAPESLLLNPARYNAARPAPAAQATRPPRPVKALVGVDVVLDWDHDDRNPDVLGRRLTPLAAPDFRLALITNRGVKVSPNGFPETFCTDHWRCRFVPADSAAPATHEKIFALLERLRADGLDFVKTEHLCTFDGKPGYSLGQRE